MPKVKPKFYPINVKACAGGDILLSQNDSDTNGVLMCIEPCQVSKLVDELIIAHETAMEHEKSD